MAFEHCEDDFLVYLLGIQQGIVDEARERYMAQIRFLVMIRAELKERGLQ